MNGYKLRTTSILQVFLERNWNPLEQVLIGKITWSFLKTTSEHRQMEFSFIGELLRKYISVFVDIKVRKVGRSELNYPHLVQLSNYSILCFPLSRDLSISQGIGNTYDFNKLIL